MNYLIDISIGLGIGFAVALPVFYLLRCYFPRTHKEKKIKQESIITTQEKAKENPWLEVGKN